MDTKCLLHKGDFQIIDSGSQKYLFLAESLRFIKIVEPAVDEYLRLCVADNTVGTFLSAQEIAQIGNFLMKDSNPMEADKPDFNYGTLTFNVTNGCNLACKYCFATPGGKHAKAITFDIAKKAIDNMLAQEKVLDEYSIFYFGGEPLLKKELLRQISEYAYQEISVKRGKKIKFLINTNATLIDEQVVSLFKDYAFIVTVSIDGPKEIHDVTRIYSNGMGSYSKVEESIQQLKMNGIVTQLRPTFSPSLKNLTAVFDFFEKLELPYGYAFSHTTNYQSNLQNTFFNTQQLKETNDELKSAMDFFTGKFQSKKTIFCTELLRKVNIIHYKSKRTHLCEAGRKNLAVDETGQYFACQTMIPHRYSALGDVNTNPDEAKRRQFMAKDISQITFCNNCPIRGLCVGGCEVERMNFGDDKLLNEQMCDIFRLEWNNILYLYAKIMDYL